MNDDDKPRDDAQPDGAVPPRDDDVDAGSFPRDTDAERLEAKRRRDRKSARERRKRKRAEREVAWQTAARDAGDGTNVVQIVAETALSTLLELHVRQTATWLKTLAADPTASTSEKVRIFVAAIPALARAVDSSEFAKRLEDLEKRIALSERGYLRSVR